MVDDDVRVPAGWYPDPLGLPQLRWWDNHAWTEHTSDARQPMVAQDAGTAQSPQQGPATQKTQAGQAWGQSGWGQQSGRTEPRLAFADDLPFADDLADIEDTEFAAPTYPDLIEPTAAPNPADLPSRREMRAQERLATADDGARDLAGDPARFAEPLSALEAPARGEGVAADSPAMRYAAAARLDDAPRTMRYDLDEVHEDLLGEPVSRISSFAHATSSTATFIPDAPEAEPVPQHAPTAAPARGRRLAAVPHTVTVPSWILTLIPVYMLMVGMLLLLGGVTAELAPVTIGLVLGVPWLAGVVIAFVDHRLLLRGGMERPAHWAWAFAGAPVYLVARLIATVREAGTGFGPVLTYIVLGLFMFGAVIAVPGLVMELAPAQFSAEAERSVQEDAASFRSDLSVDCPTTPPLLVSQAFTCRATTEDGRAFDVRVSLQRSNGWIDWRVDDWGIFTLD